MIRHIVIWKLTGNAQERAGVIEKYRENTEYLSSIIPQVREARIGVNINSGDVFHVCFDSLFDSSEDLHTYANHPEHLKIRAYYDSVSFDKAVFDYEY